MAFHLIDMDKWERAEHYVYYRDTIKTRYNLCTNIDITHLSRQVKTNGLKFYPVLLHILMQVINENRELRMGYNAWGQLGYYDVCNPAYTIFHQDDKTFSQIWTEYHPDFSVFYHRVMEDMETYKDCKGIRPKPNRPDNFCSISCVPWLSFTAYGSDTYAESSTLFPVLLMGKYIHQESQVLMPLSIAVNHAVADGYHTCKFLNEVQKLCQSFHMPNN